MSDEPFPPSEDNEHANLNPSVVRVPAFLETEPGVFTSIEDCSRSQIESQILSLTMHARALLDQAQALERYLDHRADG